MYWNARYFNTYGIDLMEHSRKSLASFSPMTKEPDGIYPYNEGDVLYELMSPLMYYNDCHFYIH